MSMDEYTLGRKKYSSPVSNKNNKWHAIAELVGTWGWTRGVCSREFVKQPVRRRTEALLMLLPTYLQLLV